MFSSPWVPNSILIVFVFPPPPITVLHRIAPRSANRCVYEPQIVPTASNGVDAVNFRQMHESMSLQLEKQSSLTPIKAVAGSSLPGTPGLGDSDGLDPSPSPRTVDEFSAFSSITLQYDGES